MKRFLTILIILMIKVHSFGSTIYFSTSGNDATGNGTIGNPYATLGKAASVSVNGDKLHAIAGHFNQITQVIIPIGVSLEGEGYGSEISLNYNFPGLGPNAFYQGAIMFTSTTEGTNGNQSISNIWFDGNNFACFQGVVFKCRSNITLTNVKFTNFQVCGLHLSGKLSENTGTPPSTFSTNIQVNNCIFIDCNDRQIQAANSVSCGSVTFEGVGGVTFNNDTTYNYTNPKGIGHNGDCYAAIQGNFYSVTWNNPVSQKPIDEGNSFNFVFELWYDMGNCTITGGQFKGGGNTIDIGYGGANRGAFSKSWYITHNYSYNDALLTFNNAWPTGSNFLQFESSTRVAGFSQTPPVLQNATDGDVVVQYNQCHNVGSFIQVSFNNYPNDFFKNVQIDHNWGDNFGYAANAYSGVITFTITRARLFDSTNIDNNTLLSNQGAGSSKGIFIFQPDTGTMQNFNIRNDIAQGAINAYGYIVFRGNNACDKFIVNNNNPFQNAFTNNAFVFAGTPAPTNSNLVNGNIKTDPQFVNASAQNFNLKVGSPCINGGINPPATYIGAFPPSGTTVPTITWTPANLTYGTGVGIAQLNATSGGVTGTFVYNPGSGTILNAGVQRLRLTFTPSDLNTYSIVTDSADITVNQATATLAASNLTQTYTGAPLQPTITTTPAGLTVINNTYNGVSTIPTNAASYALVSGLSNANYVATPISNTFTINPASVVITVSNTTQTYTGSPLAVLVSTNPNVSGISVTYNGSPTVPTNAGSYTVIASLSNSNYTATPVTTTLVINKATPTVSWSTPSPITFGTALSGTQLNATASIAGTFTYTPASGVTLNAGTNVLSVNFTPTDATNYNSVNNTTVNLVVNQATATISLSNLNQTFDGLPKPVTVTTSPIGLTVITTTYNGSTTVPSAVGTYPVISSLLNNNYTATPATGNLVISTNSATIFITNYSNLVYSGTPKVPTVTCPYSFALTYNGSPTAPTNVGSYTTVATINDGIHTGADTVTMTIIKATPVIVWSNPNAITFGTALSGTQLNANSVVLGTFAYNPVSGTVLNAGTYILSTLFTPSDASNYNTATATVSITVNKATATLSLGNLNQVYDSTSKFVTITVTPSGLSGVTVLYNGSDTAAINAGSYTINVSLSNANYTANPVTGTLIIAKANPILAWTQPQPIVYGTQLTSVQLNAQSNKTGSFTYNPPSGTILSTGTKTLTATFHPTNNNYNSNTVQTTISVYGQSFLQYYIIHGKTIYINK